MSFLNTTAIWVAAGLTLPPLLALYFLKLRRTVQFVPSTLLWKKAIEDLHVNAPFQRLRSSLLLLLQLLILILGAFALGKPMLQTTKTFEDTIIILVDQSASMSVIEADGRTRLEQAKDQAKRQIDNMGDDSRAMVIAFSDRASVVASFDSDRAALKRKIDSIEQTQRTTTLSQAISLAEAYAQIDIIGGEEGGADRAPESSAPPASMFIFTDGRVADAAKVSLQRSDGANIRVIRVGARGDNVGIIAMDARRNYERPTMLEVAATVQNFQSTAVSVDAVLYVGGQNVDVQTMTLAPAEPEGQAASTEAASASADVADTGSIAVVAFDNVEYEGSGVIEVVLRLDDALPADDRAWTIIAEPKSLRVLLVTPFNWFLEWALTSMNIELTAMKPDEYEKAPDEVLTEGARSLFDVVIIDRHSTARLPQGNYFFWGGVPQLEDVALGAVVDNEVIANWDETHPLLRHVAIETLSILRWNSLELPKEATAIVEGESGPILAFFTRGGSQFLISAFSLISEDEQGRLLSNTDWAAGVPFILFMQNAVHYLAGEMATTGRNTLRPGEAVTLGVPDDVSELEIRRPDGRTDRLAVADAELAHYGGTDLVGAYEVTPSKPDARAFAVNLFDANESSVAPAAELALGAQRVAAQAESVEVNQPAWRYVLMGLLAILLLEWIVYNRRIFV